MDMVTMNLLDSTMVSICREMGITLMKTSYSTVFKPVFYEGELIGFAVAIGHIAEVGGMVPGAFAGEATEIFHEGLRVPPLKIVKAGKDVEEVWKLMLANVRTPRYNYGDMRALISSV